MELQLTGTKKIVWGVVINICAVFVGLIGLGLTSTFIGACIGVPMIVAALPLLVWGVMWTVQGQTQKTRDAVASGVQRGIERSQAAKPPSGVDSGAPKTGGGSGQADSAPGSK